MTGNKNPAGHPDWHASALAWYFVIVWGGGFLATKVGLHYAGPFTFLSLRYTFGLLCLAPIVVFGRLRWPASPRAWMHVAMAGLLLHAMQLGGSHSAQYYGMTAGTTALIMAVQPLLTAFIAALWMDEKLAPLQWLGVVVGLGGMVLVVWHKIDVRAISPASLTAVLVGLTGATLGTMYQRRFCRDIDWRTGTLIQFAVSLALLLPLAWGVEKLRVQWSWQVVAAAGFLVIAASILALNAFHWLMRRGQATRVASLIYLTPIIASLAEFLMFNVVPSWLSVAGMAIVCSGVAMVAVRPAAVNPALPDGAVPDSPPPVRTQP